MARIGFPEQGDEVESAEAGNMRSKSIRPFPSADAAHSTGYEPLIDAPSHQNALCCVAVNAVLA
jgi:hypothetical protein